MCIRDSNNLGDILKEVGELDEAVSCFKKAYTLEPSFVAAHSNCLLAMHYCQGQTAASLYELHKAWDEDHAQEFQSLWPTHSNSRASDRRLRVGFVSPDLGRHPVGYFTVGLFEHLLKEEVQIIAYSDRSPDALTERIRAATDEWNETAGISDEALADKILTDNIDILFDLTGHSANNRLLVFARKPAPVQVSWAGYVGTTGLSAMDYYLSDKFSTREEEEPFYSEKVIRMPDSWLCYTPPNYAPAVGPSPYKENGYITFCSFSNPAKINDATLSVWSKIISAIPNSILLIKYGGIDSNANRKRLESNFEKNGINLSRLILEGKSPHAELLARYNDADIALDPFPYSGGLTTTEALWMGVPVITLPGDTFASRHSLSYLSVLGFPELIAKTEAEYVEIAIDFATDTDKLVNLRATLREKMSTSPICDYENFAKNFTAIMRDIWRDWCEQNT